MSVHRAGARSDRRAPHENTADPRVRPKDARQQRSDRPTSHRTNSPPWSDFALARKRGSVLLVGTMQIRPTLWMFSFAAALALLACADPRAAKLGIACTANADCAEGQTCQTGAPMGYCTQPCQTAGSTSECPSGGLCTDVTLGGATMRICARICQNQSDCRTGYQCNGVSGSSVKSCRPN